MVSLLSPVRERPAPVRTPRPPASAARPAPGRGRHILPVTQRWQSRIERLRLPASQRFRPFPAIAWQRWLLRLAFAAPYLALAVWEQVVGTGSIETPNRDLLARVARIDWASADVSWMHQIFPPLSTLIALIVRVPVGLSVVAALMAGYLLQRMLEIMAQRGYPPVAVGLLMLALAANPLTSYAVTQNLSGFLGLALFGLGIADCYRFVVWGHTQAGFRAGLLLMLAVLTAPEAPLYVTIAALATPFMTLGRHRGQARVRSSQVLVVVFPSAAAILSLTGLAWVFTGDPLAVIGAHTFDGMAERWSQLGVLFSTVSGLFLVLTVLSACAVGVIVRRPGAIVVAVLLFVGILAAFVIGFLPPSSAGNTFIMMMILAISVLPIARRIQAVIAVNVVALCQIGLAWGTALNRDVVIAWLHAIGIG